MVVARTRTTAAVLAYICREESQERFQVLLTASVTRNCSIGTTPPPPYLVSHIFLSVPPNSGLSRRSSTYDKT